MDQAACSKCNLPVLTAFYFCPNCGKSLRPKPLSTSIGKQIGVYLVSFFLPPLGLWPGIRYLFQKSGKAKVIGIIAVLLTMISVLITLQLVMGIVDQFNQQLSTQVQLNQLP